MWKLLHEVKVMAPSSERRRWEPAQVHDESLQPCNRLHTELLLGLLLSAAQFQACGGMIGLQPKTNHAAVSGTMNNYKEEEG
jgi:hypothetical protein